MKINRYGVTYFLILRVIFILGWLYKEILLGLIVKVKKIMIVFFIFVFLLKYLKMVRIFEMVFIKWFFNLILVSLINVVILRLFYFIGFGLLYI